MIRKIVSSIVLIVVAVSLIGCDVTNDEPTDYIISFDTKEGSSVESVEVEAGSEVDLPTSSKEGYSFSGWTATDNEEADLIVEPFTPEANVTLYAKWSINEYTISFETNGGTQMNPITENYDIDLTRPSNPTKSGYVFEGWYTDSNLIETFTFTSMPAEDTTLYAKWEEVDFSDVEEYLTNLIPNKITEDITLPLEYEDYTISWTSSNTEVFSNLGEYTRPYQPVTINLTADIQLGESTTNETYTIEVEAYKSLSAPLASSYIYRDYNTVDDAFFTTLDIINCAFIHADDQGELSGTSVLNNIMTYIMPKAKEHGNWVIFSIAPSSDWSEIAVSSTKVDQFADNIVEMINTYGFDGVDIDWETPTDLESTRFTNMMEVIYTKVKENNPNHLVTAAVAGGMWQPPRYDLANSHQYLDYINMMTYGMVSNNGYYQNALLQSRTFADQENLVGKTLTSCSIEESVAIYNTFGIPNSKIIVGVAFYGIKQTRSFNTSTQTWSSWTKEESVSYTRISSYYLNSDEYSYHYDANAGVPYIISTDGTTFISYDNPRSIAQKSEFIIDNNLGGMMYWEHAHDSTGALLIAIDNGINE